MGDKNDGQNIIHKSTPPSTNRRIRNPFDKVLIDKLHKPICSPGMCKIYKKKSNGTFRWDIEQACALVPADIVVCNSQFEPSPDPALEKIAEEATDRFFSQEMVMPSPLIESSKKVKPLSLTSCDASIQIDSVIQEKMVLTKDVSAQTVLTLPPELPQTLEILLKPFCTYTQDQDISDEYEITANGSLRRKLFFEEHSDIDHYDSEQTDDEIHVEPRPPSRYESHTPVVVSPDISQDFVSKGMKRTFGTPLKKISLGNRKPCYQNKILNVVDYAEPSSSPKEFRTPRRTDQSSTTSSSLASISPITKAVSSDDESQEFVLKGMKRAFDTPLDKGSLGIVKPCYRNKLLNVVDFGEPCFSPKEFRTPKRTEQNSTTSSSLASNSISPITKAASSDEEKNNYESPYSETMATCLDCVQSRTQSEKKCLCKLTPNKIKRSASLKESPPRGRKASFSFSEKRSLSMSSLHRSRSVQKLDFSMDMSIDGSMHNKSQADSETRSPLAKEASWSLVEEANIHQLVKVESTKNVACDIQSSTQLHSIVTIDDTPIKTKSKSNIRSHEISKIRAPLTLSPLHMSLDSSLDNLDNPLSLEDKKIDFNRVDLKFLTEFDYTANNTTKVGTDSSTSYKKVDSGFNENTFYANASSYYESAIKPSELTVTNVSKNNSKNPLKEISNVHWMRVDSGFKDECSSDATQFYSENEEMSSKKQFTGYHFVESKLNDKENIVSEDFLVQTNKNEAMSMSDIFTDELTFNCNFSSTPSKSKARKINS